MTSLAMSVKSSAASTEESKPIDHPFTFSDADVVLRSSDGVKIRLHRSILSIASPFFKDLFSLPQDQATTKITTSRDDDATEPVMDVSEDSHTLCNLFGLLYPVSEPMLDSLTDIAAVMSAAQKYQLDRALAISQQKMVGLAITDPIRVYAFGCHMRDQAVAQAGARASRRLPSLAKVKELRLMTGMDYRLLLDFHALKSNADTLFSNFNWIHRGVPSLTEENGTPSIFWDANQTPSWFVCTVCPRAQLNRGGYWGQSHTLWWDGYMNRIATEVKDYAKDGSCATSPSNIVPALEQSASCTAGCASESTIRAFRVFTQFVETEINKRYKIELDF